MVLPAAHVQICVVLSCPFKCCNPVVKVYVRHLVLLLQEYWRQFDTLEDAVRLTVLHYIMACGEQGVMPLLPRRATAACV